MITGSSGSGKTTLLDRVCGLLAEEHSQWQVTCDQQHWSFSGVAGASPVLSHVIRPLLASAPRWLPGGPHTLLLALYLAGFPGLYLYMFAQRKKVLGGGRAQKKKEQRS